MRVIWSLLRCDHIPSPVWRALLVSKAAPSAILASSNLAPSGLSPKTEEITLCTVGILTPPPTISTAATVLIISSLFSITDASADWQIASDKSPLKLAIKSAVMLEKSSLLIEKFTSPNKHDSTDSKQCKSWWGRQHNYYLLTSTCIRKIFNGNFSVRKLW